MNMILVFTHLLNGLLMVAIPIGLGIFLSRRFKLGWRLWWIGGATFVLSQVGHIPFNVVVGQLFTSGALPTPPQQYTLLFQSLFLGLSAGFWEEGARFAAYRWWAKDARSWSRGLMMGAGHGGMEAIILGTLVLVTYIAMIAVRNMDLSRLVPAEQLASGAGASERLLVGALVRDPPRCAGTLILDHRPTGAIDYRTAGLHPPQVVLALDCHRLACAGGCCCGLFQRNLECVHHRGDHWCVCAHQPGCDFLAAPA